MEVSTLANICNRIAVILVRDNIITTEVGKVVIEMTDLIHNIFHLEEIARSIKVSILTRKGIKRLVLDFLRLPSCFKNKNSQSLFYTLFTMI